MPIEEWNSIQSRSETCSTCAKGFADKETYHTLLRLTSEGYMRQDLCNDCWTKAGSPDKRAGTASYWVGTFVVPPPAKPEALKREDAESLLRKYIDSPDPAHENVRYILAIMLERKRTLKQRDVVHRDGDKLLIYEHMRTGETFMIPDPQLRLDQLEAVQTEVVALLAPPSAAEVALDSAMAAGAAAAAAQNAPNPEADPEKEDEEEEPPKAGS